MAHAAERGLVWIRHWSGAVRVWAAKPGLQSVCIFRLLRPSNLCEHRTQAVFDLKLMVGGGEHKVVLEENEFRVYDVYTDWGLNFLSVRAYNL